MVAAGFGGLAVGLVLGLALGSGEDDPDPLQGVREARSSLQRSADVLDIVTVEYAEGIEDGRVASEPEYQGARRALDRSFELFSEGRPVLVYVNRGEAARIDDAFGALRSAVRDRAAEPDVEARARALARALDGAIAPGQ
jgi:hypothetical protein